MTNLYVFPGSLSGLFKGAKVDISYYGLDSDLLQIPQTWKAAYRRSKSTLKQAIKENAL